jgi:5-methyltetrahydropteroyltriglutamate--homocysteine methyltransferase
VKRSDDRILTTHVGSLVRTPGIIEAMIKAEIGEPVDADAFAATLTESVDEVVKKQADVGLDIIDDGEFGKVGWVPYVAERLGGMEQFEVPDGAVPMYPEADRYGGFYAEYLPLESTQWLPDTPSTSKYKGTMNLAALACTGPIVYKPEAVERDIANLKRALQDVNVEEAFLPVVSPISLEVYPNMHYGSQEDYLAAIADALNVEYRAIVDAGYILQVDDAVLLMQRAMSFANKSIDEYRAWAEVRMDVVNRALEGIPEDRVRYHVCYGSQNVPHTSDPPMKDVIDLVLKVNAQAYAIESANPQHEHEWQLWKDKKLPDGKILIPGVISHCTNVVENPELVALRLENFASVVGRENVIAGTDCGFSQFWNLIRTHPEVQWAKMEALVEGAQLASKRIG